MLNYLASLIYVLTAILCLSAAYLGRSTGRSRSDMIVWLGASAMFAVLIGMRLLGGEDVLRDMLRGVAAGEGFYNARRMGQVAALIVIAGIGWLGWRKIRDDWLKKRGSRSANYVRIALLGMAGFVLLYSLRLVSLHFVDQLLYAGPIRLNWVLDGALTGTLAVSAFFYLRHCRRSPPGQWVIGEKPGQASNKP